MELTNETIWNAITNSAKKRFDYASFEKESPFVTDTILLKIIIDLASRKSTDTIASQVQKATNNEWSQEQIEAFIADKDEVFKREIFATKLYGNMQYEGNELEDMYYEVSKYIITD